DHRHLAGFGLRVDAEQSLVIAEGRLVSGPRRKPYVGLCQIEEAACGNVAVDHERLLELLLGRQTLARPADTLDDERAVATQAVGQLNHRGLRIQRRADFSGLKAKCAGPARGSLLGVQIHFAPIAEDLRTDDFAAIYSAALRTDHDRAARDGLVLAGLEIAKD